MRNMLLWMNVSLTRFNQGLVFTQAGRGRKVTFAVFFRWLSTTPKDWSRIHLSTTACSKRQSLIKPWFLELYVWGVAGWVLFAEFAAMLLQKKIEFLDDQILANQLGKRSRNLMFAWIIVFSHLKKIWPNWLRFFLFKHIFTATEFSQKKHLEDRRAQLP